MAIRRADSALAGIGRRRVQGLRRSGWNSGKGVGHEMKEGKPVAAGKDLGEGIGKGGKDVGKESRKLSALKATVGP